MQITRIGLVGPLPPPYGGMANQTRQLGNLLGQEGVHVECVPTNAAYRPAWVGKIKGLRAVVRLLPYFYRLWRTAGKVQLVHIMANSGWSWHLFAAPAIWIARFRKIPVVVNYRGGGAETFFQKSWFWVKPSLDITDAIIVPSGFLEVVFGQRGYTATIVPNIIDLSRFTAGSSEDRRDYGDSPHIVVTRNLEAIYDNATAIRAFAIAKKSFPNARLTVAGVGPEKSMLENLASELGVQDAVQFAGRIDNDAVAALYRSADLMINASLVDNMPISILEALASGIPVVSTDAGGIPYLVEHGRTALLVPKKDPATMAEAIVQVLNDHTLIKNLKKQGLQLVQKFAWPVIKNQLLSVYRRVL